MSIAANTSKPAPGLAQVLLLVGLYFGLTAAVIQCVRLTAIPIDADTLFLLRLIIAWPITLWVGLRWRQSTFKEAFTLRKFPLRLLPALCIATFGVTILILEAVKWMPAYEVFHRINTDYLAGTSKLTLFLPVIVAGPIAEELFFRGLVLRGFLGRYPISQAVGASALLFACFHLNLWTAVAVLPLGFGFAWLALRTNSLVPGILSHMMVNITTNYLVDPPRACVRQQPGSDL